MMKHTKRKDYKKHIFNLKNGWADDKKNKEFKESTWKLAMKYVDRLIKELDLPEPMILPCGPNDIDLNWDIDNDFNLLIAIPGDLTEGIDYYGQCYRDGNVTNEISGMEEEFETTISKIVNWYKKIKKD